jgi:CRP/FNR family transcriptional regulator, dissimilatory nitrate respiration regulator
LLHAARLEYMTDANALRSLEIFTGLSPATLDRLAAAAVERRYAPDQVLYATGSEPAGLLVILEGSVRVVRGRNGRQQLVHEEKSGGALGEVPVFAGGGYPATAIASEPTRCAMLSTAALRAIIREDADVAFIFLRRLAQRTRGLVGLVDRLSSQDVNGRLAALILRRCEAGADAFPLGRTQTEVAEELGTVREVLVRALRQLRQAGLIQALGRGRYRVSDCDGLKRIATAPPGS